VVLSLAGIRLGLYAFIFAKNDDRTRLTALGVRFLEVLGRVLLRDCAEKMLMCAEILFSLSLAFPAALRLVRYIV
jgi:hypothetical protein